MSQILAISIEFHEVLMISGIVIMTFILLVNLRKHRSHASEDADLTHSERIERMKQKHEMKDDIRAAMVELEEVTRRFSTHIDAKSMQLEHLINLADERIEQLEQLNGSAGHAGEQDSAENRDSGGSDDGVTRGGNDKVDSTEPVNAIPGGRSASSAGEASSEVVEAEAGLDEVTSKIYEMSDAGQSAVEIASALEEHVGKVELILALRQ